eukprot:125634-Pleurochrysis_carterae.AAC.2
MRAFERARSRRDLYVTAWRDVPGAGAGWLPCLNPIAISEQKRSLLGAKQILSLFLATIPQRLINNSDSCAEGVAESSWQQIRIWTHQLCAQFSPICMTSQLCRVEEFYFALGCSADPQLSANKVLLKSFARGNFKPETVLLQASPKNDDGLGEGTGGRPAPAAAITGVPQRAPSDVVNQASVYGDGAAPKPPADNPPVPTPVPEPGANALS